MTTRIEVRSLFVLTCIENPHSALYPMRCRYELDSSIYRLFTFTKENLLMADK
jgi:hypothetical protein